MWRSSVLEGVPTDVDRPDDGSPGPAMEMATILEQDDERVLERLTSFVVKFAHTMRFQAFRRTAFVDLL